MGDAYDRGEKCKVLIMRDNYQDSYSRNGAWMGIRNCPVQGYCAAPTVDPELEGQSRVCAWHEKQRVEERIANEKWLERHQPFREEKPVIPYTPLRRFRFD